MFQPSGIRSISRHFGPDFIHRNLQNESVEVVLLGFRYVSTDYYETQVVRVGYGYKFWTEPHGPERNPRRKSHRLPKSHALHQS